MSDKLASFSTAKNPLVGSTESLKKEKKFTVNTLIKGIHTLSARQLCLIFLINLMSVLCISVVTTVATAHIIGLTKKGIDELNSNNGTIDPIYSPIHSDKQEYISTEGNREALKGENGKKEKRSLGQKGIPGDKGSRGNNGFKGDKGDRGIRGEFGCAGRKGENGTRGHKGEKGIIGNEGQAGEKGTKGEKGHIGEYGPHGLPGINGNQGPIGNKGPAGDKGEVGDTGLTGDKGQSGSKGRVGDKGQTGDKGSAGEKGDVSEKGGKGNNGSIAVDRACGAGWMSFGKYCYYLGYSKKTWQDAQKDCRRRSSNLVKIENAMENWLLKSFSKDEGLTRAWIGANDLSNDGHMEWVSDKTSVIGGFSNWSPGEPNNHAKLEHCTNFWSDLCYKWNDSPCGMKLAYICKT